MPFNPLQSLLKKILGLKFTENAFSHQMETNIVKPISPQIVQFGEFSSNSAQLFEMTSLICNYINLQNNQGLRVRIENVSTHL